MAEAFKFALILHETFSLDKPEVVAEADAVYSGVGRGATLGCRVYSAPEAEVKWYRGTMLIEPDNFRSECYCIVYISLSFLLNWTFFA